MSLSRPRKGRVTVRVAFLLWVVSPGVVLAGGNCAGISTGLVPLTDLGQGSYQGMQGGLYPGGVNSRPAPHETAAESAARVLLLDPNGVPSASTGRIVLLTVGMSNASQESQACIPLAGADPSKNSRVTIVNGAQGGWTATRVADPNQNATYWSTVDQRLAQSGVTQHQVQAIWLKEAESNPTQTFPADALGLKDNLARIARIIHDRYPNARQIFTSSRIYAGYASSTLNPEPFAYQSGFSVKWLVEDQLAGAPGLNFDPARGPVQAPWISWGPYLWADGLTPREDGLTWTCDDLGNDGTHPSTAGASKVAGLLLDFFLTDRAASVWFADCAPSDPGVFAAPPRILGLDVQRNPATGGVELRYDDLAPVAGPATRYDVAAGTLASLRTSGGFAGALCVLAGVPGSGGPDPVADPPPGAGVYYLVRGRNACGAGTWGEPDAAPPRAGLDASSLCGAS